MKNSTGISVRLWHLISVKPNKACYKAYDEWGEKRFIEAGREKQEGNAAYFKRLMREASQERSRFYQELGLRAYADSFYIDNPKQYLHIAKWF